MTWVGTLMRASTASGSEWLIELDRRATAPLPLRRRVTVASLQGGEGCSTVAAELAIMLSKLRSEPVYLRHLVNDASPLPAVPEGIRVEQDRLDISSGASGPSGLGDRLHPARGEPGLTIIDAGALSINELRDSLSWSHVLCLVSSASRPAIQQGYDVATALEAQAPVLMCTIDVDREAVQATRDLLESVSLPTFFIPFDQRRHRGRSWGHQPLKRASHELLRLAAAVTDAAQSERGGQNK